MRGNRVKVFAFTDKADDVREANVGRKTFFLWTKKVKMENRVKIINI